MYKRPFWNFQPDSEQKPIIIPSASLTQNGMLADADLEENKLVVEFMGWEIEPGMENEIDPFYNEPYKAGFIPRMILLSKFPFRSSWDWLMPVWKKLGNLMYEIRRQVSGEDYKRAEIITINVLKAFQKVEINSAFNWIVEAIKWYNAENNKSA